MAHLHLKDKGHSFDDANLPILNRRDWLFEKGVNETIYAHCEQQTLNRGHGLRQQLSATCNPDPFPAASTSSHVLYQVTSIICQSLASEHPSIILPFDSNVPLVLLYQPTVFYPFVFLGFLSVSVSGLTLLACFTCGFPEGGPALLTYTFGSC